LFFLFGPSGKRPVRLQATNWFLFIYLFVPTLNFPPDDHHHLSQQQKRDGQKYNKKQAIPGRQRPIKKIKFFFFCETVK
jgi:hypothetical protein